MGRETRVGSVGWWRTIGAENLRDSPTTGDLSEIQLSFLAMDIDGLDSGEVQAHEGRAAQSEFIETSVALSPYKMVEWLSLTPAERLQRSWALRERLVDPQAVHDRKLFPSP